MKFKENIKNEIYTFEQGLPLEQEKIGFTKEKQDHISDAIDGLHNNIANRIYKTNTVFPLDTITFEEETFPCPQNADEYLTKIYGSEYMHLPKIALDHDTEPLVKSQFNSQNEEQEQFKTDIKLLKTINERF